MATYKQWTCVVLAILCARCDRAEKQPEKQSPPAQVSNRVSESDLAVVTLTADAERRLGLNTENARSETIQRTRTYAGEVSAPPGRRVQITSPLAGIVGPAGGAALPMAGAALQKGDSICQVFPAMDEEREVLGASDRISQARVQYDLQSALATVRGDIASATARHDAAMIKHERARKMLADHAGSARAADEAQAELSVTQAELKAATSRLEVLEASQRRLAASGAEALLLRAPFDGIVSQVLVAEDQVISAGATLFEFTSIDPLWVRAPVFVGEINELSTTGDAAVLTFTTTRPPTSAKRVKGPPSANPAAYTVDLFYEIDNRENQFRPGERVQVEIPLNQDSTALTIPAIAILYDPYGGAWVYEKIGDLRYTRRRVDLKQVLNDRALVEGALKEGALVVSQGASELFGVEFGAGK